MTTSNITGVNQYSRTDETKGPKGPKPPKPEEQAASSSSIVDPSKSFDTYTPSEGALAALEAAAEETTEDVATEDVAADATTDGTATAEARSDLVNQLKADLEMNQAKFVNDMVSMITGQASAFTGTNIWEEYQVTAEMQAEAQANIAEGGYWSAEETATRIVDMAKALVGDDPTKADAMMAAIEKGFEAAESAWGGELPSITADTKALIDTMFDDWKNGVS